MFKKDFPYEYAITFAILSLIASLISCFLAKNIIGTIITAIGIIASIAVLIINWLRIKPKKYDATLSMLSPNFKPCLLRYDGANKLDILLRYYEYYAKVENGKTIVIQARRGDKTIDTVKTTDYQWFYNNFMVPNSYIKENEQWEKKQDKKYLYYL